MDWKTSLKTEKERKMKVALLTNHHHLSRDLINQGPRSSPRSLNRSHHQNHQNHQSLNQTIPRCFQYAAYQTPSSHQMLSSTTPTPHKVWPLTDKKLTWARRWPLWDLVVIRTIKLVNLILSSALEKLLMLLTTIRKCRWVRSYWLGWMIKVRLSSCPARLSNPYSMIPQCSPLSTKTIFLALMRN